MHCILNNQIPSCCYITNNAIRSSGDRVLIGTGNERDTSQSRRTLPRPERNARSAFAEAQDGIPHVLPPRRVAGARSLPSSSPARPPPPRRSLEPPLSPLQHGRAWAAPRLSPPARASQRGGGSRAWRRCRLRRRRGPCRSRRKSGRPSSRRNSSASSGSRALSKISTALRSLVVCRGVTDLCFQLY
jgi:hypothetical protein